MAAPALAGYRQGKGDCHSRLYPAPTGPPLPLISRASRSPAATQLQCQLPVMQSSILAHVAHPTFLVALTVGYVAAQIVYRRFFHPLAKTPGPFLPAVTTLYQSYYNGRYYLEIERLHKKYGALNTPRRPNWLILTIQAQLSAFSPMRFTSATRNASRLSTMSAPNTPRAPSTTARCVSRTRPTRRPPTRSTSASAPV